MPKKTLLYIIRWSVALAACVYLVWKLATYDDYASLWNSLSAMGKWQYIALTVCMALMPVNMSLEAWRWKTLMADELSWREAHREVYYSKLAGLITPWRVGEYPARGLLMAESTPNEQREKLMARVLAMGAVGSVTMTVAILFAGLLAVAFSPSVLVFLGDSYLYALCAVLVVTVPLFALLPRLLDRWAKVDMNLLIESLLQSLARLACWCVQLLLVLYALGAASGDTILLTPVYYLLVTFTPNVPLAEVGVRGAWAIVVFGSMNAALAGVLLWVINTLLPCAIWPFYEKKENKFA